MWGACLCKSVVHTCEENPGIVVYVLLCFVCVLLRGRHLPYLFQIGMGDCLGGKIGLFGVMFHVSCVGCGLVVGIGDIDRGGVGIGVIAVGDCSEVLRVLHDMCSVWLSEKSSWFVW